MGEQQRVMLARSLAQEPDVLLLDEPTSALDEERARRRSRRLCCACASELGLSYVLVTHDPEQAARMSDWVVRLAMGGHARVSAPIDVSLGQLAATLVLVAIAVAVSVWRARRPGAGHRIAVARSFIQLSAIGLVINAIFEQDRIIFVIALIAAMVLFGALTARNRARHVPGAFWPLLDGARRRPAA